MNNIKYIITTFSILLVLLSSCSYKNNEGNGHSHDSDDETTHSDSHGHEEVNMQGTILSRDQAETIGLEFGELSFVKVNDFVKATGTLGLPPNALFSVSAKTSGLIKGTKEFVEGSYIKEGDVIAYLENPDFIVLQQDYLEAKAQLNLKRMEVERQKTLVESNAGVGKNLQNAQAEEAVMEAKAQGLAKQLLFFGVSVTNLLPSNIQHQIAIVAPISGYVSKINFHNGMYVQPSIVLMDIISSDHLYLELDVFEKDIVNIKKGQKISYTVPALGKDRYYGSVRVTGKEFNLNSKTVRVIGQLDEVKPNFFKGLFIDAKIFLTDAESTALPENAIIKDGESNYIYVALNTKETSDIEFKRINIIPGSTDNGYTAVKLIDEIPDGMQIVTKGAYYVYAQSKAGELEHEH